MREPARPVRPLGLWLGRLVRTRGQAGCTADIHTRHHQRGRLLGALGTWTCDGQVMTANRAPPVGRHATRSAGQGPVAAPAGDDDTDDRQPEPRYVRGPACQWWRTADQWPTPIGPTRKQVRRRKSASATRVDGVGSWVRSRRRSTSRARTDGSRCGAGSRPEAAKPHTNRGTDADGHNLHGPKRRPEPAEPGRTGVPSRANGSLCGSMSRARADGSRYEAVCHRELCPVSGTDRRVGTSGQVGVRIDESATS